MPSVIYLQEKHPFSPLDTVTWDRKKAPPYLFIINRMFFNFFLRLQQLVLKSNTGKEKNVCLYLLKKK